MTKVLGILLMMPCVIVMSLDKKDASKSVYHLSEHQMTVYGLLAILSASAAPFFWTVRAYYLRKANQKGTYPVEELAIDLNIFYGMI